MIPDFKTYIKESVWSDIHKRSNGEKIRKEDDVDLLDREGLLNYIKDHYNGKGAWLLTSEDMGGMISVEIFENKGGYYGYLTFNDIEGDPEISVLGGLDVLAKNIYDDMKSRYYVNVREYEDVSGHPCNDVIVKPKDCRYFKLTNSFYLDVLDFILERIDYPLLKTIEKK